MIGNKAQAERLPVPVIVVGNITVGGAGKTPLTLWLARQFRERGWRPGIVSRGYGGDNAVPRPVTPSSLPAEVGDEPVLLGRRSGVPVWVGRDRVAAGRSLLAAHPDVNLILCDDGLQHYRLARDVELAVFDGRGAGNGWRLPAGPLRESLERLREVDAVVCNGKPDRRLPPDLARFDMRLQAGRFYNLDDPQRQCRRSRPDRAQVACAGRHRRPGALFPDPRGTRLAFQPPPVSRSSRLHA